MAKLQAVLVALSLSSLLGALAVGQGRASAPRPAGVSGDTVRHIDPSGLDTYLACVRKVTGRTVVVAATPSPVTDMSLPACPASEEVFVLDMAARGRSVSTTGSWSYVYPAEWRTGGGRARVLGKPEWSTIQVKTTVSEWDTGDAPAGDAARAIAAEAIRSVRPLLIWADPLGVLEGRPHDTLDIRLLVDRRPKNTNGVPPVVVFYGQAQGFARFVYGEMRGGRFTVVWDSPLLWADSVEYADLTGDDIPELIARGREGLDGRLFTAFTLAGEELTRQSPCEPWTPVMQALWDPKEDRPRVEDYRGGGFTCPIIGHRDRDFEIVERPGRPADLVGKAWVNDPPTLQDVTYRLVKGRYLRQKGRTPGRQP